MPKIDTSKIEGFDGMSAEDKLTALLAMDIPEAPDPGQFVKKSLFDQKASELAEANRKLKSKMTEDERTAAEQAEKAAQAQTAHDELQARYDEAMKQLTVMSYKQSYLAMGYDEKMAQDSAEAMQSGDMERVFANAAKHQADVEKKTREKLLMSDQWPKGGKGADGSEDVSVAEAKKRAQARGGDQKKYSEGLALYIKK